MARLDAGRISTFQGGWLIVSTIVPWGVLYIGSLVIQVAGQSAWMSLIPPMLLGLVIAWLAVDLARRFPGETFVGVMTNVVGKLPGKVLGALYVVWFITVAAATAQGFSVLIISTILPQTPPVTVIVSFTFIVFIGVRSGIEVLSRVATTVGFAVVLFLLVLLLLSAREIETANFFPLVPDGMWPVWQGSYIAAGFFGEVAVAAFVVLPFLKRPDRAFPAMASALAASTAISMLATLWYIGLFTAPVAARWTFSAVELARYIEIADFLTRIEPLFISGWVLINFAKMGVWYYAACYAAGELLSLRDYRALTVPTGIVIGVMSLYSFDNVTEFFAFARLAATPCFLVFQLAIPLVVWFVARVRRR